MTLPSLFDMLPGATQNYVADSASMYTEFGPEADLRFALRVSPPNFMNLVLRELSGKVIGSQCPDFWMQPDGSTVSPCMSPLGNHIGVIFGVRPEKEVVWPYATPIGDIPGGVGAITIVADEHSVWDGAICDNPRESVGVLVSIPLPGPSRDSNDPISAADNGTSPEPTSIRFLYSEPEPRPKAVYALPSCRFLGTRDAAITPCAARDFGRLYGEPAIADLADADERCGSFRTHVDLLNRCAVPPDVCSIAGVSGARYFTSYDEVIG